MIIRQWTRTCEWCFDNTKYSVILKWNQLRSDCLVYGAWKIDNKQNRKFRIANRLRKCDKYTNCQKQLSIYECRRTREFAVSRDISINILLLQLLLLLFLLYIQFIYRTENYNEDSSVILQRLIEDIGIYPTLKLHFKKHYLTRVNV